MSFLSANHYWRIIAAGISYLVFAIGVFIPGIYVFCLALFPMNAQTKQARVRRAIQLLCLFYINFMQFLGLIKITLQDTRNKTTSGHLVIANHSMLIDALFILAYVDNLCCVVKEQLCHNPFTRIPVKLAGYISNSADDFIQQAEQKIKTGENVLIFPEGTRNRFDTQLEFKRGAANIAIISACPILPIVIKAIPRTTQKGESWWQLPPTKSRVIIKIKPTMLTQKNIDTTLPRTLQYRRLNKFWREFYLSEINGMN